MDENNGARVSASSEVDNGSGIPSTEAGNTDSSKTPTGGDSGFNSSTPSRPIKMLLNYRNINGEGVEKDISQSEHSPDESSSNSSECSESSDVSQDSVQENAGLETESSNDVSISKFSKPSLNYSFAKSSDNSSPFHQSQSPSDSSTDSDDMSDSDIESSNVKENDDFSRVETPDTHSSQSFQNEAPKNSLIIDEHDKANESGELSGSDSSFKKEDHLSNDESPKKSVAFDLSQSSDDSTVDSMKTSGPSLSSSISQDVSMPQEVNSGPPVFLDRAPSLTAPGEESKVPAENSEVPSAPVGTSCWSPERHDISEENSNNVKNCVFGNLQENTETSSLSDATLEKQEDSNTTPKDMKSSSSLSSLSDNVSQNINESENKSSEDSNLECSYENKNIASSRSDSDLKKSPIQNPKIEVKEDVSGFTISENEVSIIKPCSVSCFPKEESTLESSSNAEGKNDVGKDISKLDTSLYIKYEGYRSIRDFPDPESDEKSLCHLNPFSRAQKKRTKKRVLRQFVADDQDPCSLQTVYAQYLGLQPIVKFKCSYCGLSHFQSMSALNTHKIDCKRSLSTSQPVALDKNKAITIRRRVYMCSVCRSYKPRSEVFQHMLEIHKQYICLFDKCLKFCQSVEALMIHFKDDHLVVPVYSKTNEDFLKDIPPNFCLVCVLCRRVFTDMDDPANHDCSSITKPSSEHISTNTSDPERLYGMNRVPLVPHLEPSSSQTWDIAKVTATLKLNKDITMKPVNELLISESCQIQNVCNTQDIHNIISSESTSKLVSDVFSCDAISRPASDNLNIKVPSDIEIKPLMPGENHNLENQFEPTNGSSIEIFPIPQPQSVKPTRKVKTIIKKTIRKKKIIVGKKKKVIENAYVHNDILESRHDLARPISPPVIAPPPIVRTPEPEPPSDPIPMETDVPYEPDSVPKEPELLREEASTSSQYSNQDDRSMSPLHTESNPTPLPERSDVPELKRSISKDIFKIKLQSDMDSDGESSDSQKLSLVVDENTNNSEDFRKDEMPMQQEETDVTLPPENNKNDPNEVPLASEDIPAMALTLDDKIENVPIQAVVKECVRTSCMSCNYCRHAVTIAVNGKQLALHLLSEHRYTPVKNETNEDVIRKLKSSLDTLQNMHFNAETYDSSDPSIHTPYDKVSNYDCFQCNYISSSHKDLYTHKRKVHTKSLLLCIMCKKNFFSYSELICHICTGTYCANPEVYSVDINFRCCFCRLDTIPSAFRLMVHLRKSHHTCDICLEICTDQQKLSTHMWKHKLNHLCYRCGIAYASKPDITKHLFWKHGTESVLCKKCLQKKWPHVYHFCIPPTSFICEECNISFSKAVALKVHKRIHGNDYPYTCPQCEKKFVSKKLLSRHIDRHNAVIQKKDLVNKSPDDNKEEIINVTDVDNKDVFHNENSDSNKESDAKDKSHRKHKKEKDKKDKKVDVLDLPPPNLSSESDSSDEEGPRKPLLKGFAANGTHEASNQHKMSPFLDDAKAPDMPKLDGMLDDKSLESSSFLNLLKQDEGSDEFSKRKPSTAEPVSPFDSSVVSSLLSMGKDDMRSDPMDSMQNDHIEGIWENFYKTNPQNSNLPFPLCAMKSEVAYSIVMGDHDYCQHSKVEPVIKEDLPSTSNLETHLSDDKLEEISPLIPEAPQTPPPTIKESENLSTPSKKKLKSPKKKPPKTPEDKNSSSSSDSSSDSDSSCSCATNCSCSSSSDSSSSSSSDSDSSTNEDKKDKRRKKKDKKLLSKSERESDEIKETHPVEAEEEEISHILEPEDPPIRESELETDESTSDEEFYDRQPQIIANQLLAEKREKQISLSTSINNGNASPVPATPALQHVTPAPPALAEPLFPLLPPAQPAQENIPPSEHVIPLSATTPKPKPRTKRKRRTATPKTPKIEKPLPESTFPKYLSESKSSPFSLFQQSPIVKQKLIPTGHPVGRSPSLTEAAGSGSETDNTRLSKRRRVPNKFYGYSSGEDEDKPTPKWRKVEIPLTPQQTPKLPPTIVHPPPTPRIQLTVPKQIIRRPYHKQPSKQKIHHPPVSSDSTDSGSDIDIRIPRPPSPHDPPKVEKDVYCYCRCPYDEVSEMIACDDTNCKIEWFHFECVGILVPPRGQWYCPDCRKARGLPT